MSIEKFTTEGIILSEYVSGEMDVVFKIYTRDFGVITAKQSSLKKSTKLRPHLLKYKVVNVTVVKGKEIYRIAGARESEVLRGTSEVLPHICQIVLRFLAFENKNIKLYDRMMEYVNSDANDVAMTRLCIIADVMINGGYLDTQNINMTLEEYKSSSVDDMYMKVVMNKSSVVKNLRDAVDASML